MTRLAIYDAMLARHNTPAPPAAAAPPAAPARPVAAAAPTREDVMPERLARLLRWGWPANEAQALAVRLRDRDGDDLDDRVICVDCHHFRPWLCANHRRADLSAPELGRDLASMLQRCPGFDSRDQRPAAPPAAPAPLEPPT